MPYGMYISAEGAQAQITRMEVLSNNLANVDTPGFKPDHATFRARFAEAIQQGDVPPGAGEIDDVGGGVMVSKTTTDFSAATLKTTGIPTDMAIVGEGFFQIRKDGDVFLTRAGNFQLDAEGNLVTALGHEVLDESGEPVEIDPTLGPWAVTPEGGISQAGDVTLLGLAKPKSLGDLSKVGDNLFRPLAPAQPLAEEERHVRSGVIEMSGVRPTLAMMELIETSRAIEANMKLIQNQDHMLSTLISRVLQS